MGVAVCISVFVLAYEISCGFLCACVQPVYSVDISVSWLDRISEGRDSSRGRESEKQRKRRGVAVQSDAWRLNLFLTEQHQC